MSLTCAKLTPPLTCDVSCATKDVDFDFFKSKRKKTPRAFEKSVMSAFALFFEKQLPAQTIATASTTNLKTLFMTI